MNRTIMAARHASLNTGKPADTRVSVNPAMRAQTLVAAPGFTGTRRHGNKRSGKGGSSTGGVNGVWRTVSQSARDGRYDMGY